MSLATDILHRKWVKYGFKVLFISFFEFDSMEHVGYKYIIGSGFQTITPCQTRVMYHNNLHNEIFGS